MSNKRKHSDGKGEVEAAKWMIGGDGYPNGNRKDEKRDEQRRYI